MRNNSRDSGRVYDPSVARPLVSICIPTYKGEAFIGRAIESVLAQTLDDFELLIVDDSSPDQTASVIARYQDPRIQFLHNARNLGPRGNWNRCLDEANGRYFKLLPQDDVLAPECLARQVAIMEDDTAEKIALVFCARNILDANDRVLLRRDFPGRNTGVIPARDVIRHCLWRGTNLIGEPGSVLFRLALARRIGRFDDDAPYVIDLDYWSRLLCQGDAYYLADALASFRVSRSSWSVAIGTRQSADFGRFVTKVAKVPGFAVGGFDVLAGRIMSHLNTVLRMVFYRMLRNYRKPA